MEGFFHENAVFNVGAALLRGDAIPAKDDRRSEIGSHTLPSKAAIFVRGGELEEVTKHFI